MTREERDIMKDAFFYLRDFIDPPDDDTPECDQFWDNAAQRLTELGAKWNHHPLAMEVLLAIYNYIETKSKQKAGDHS